MKKAETGLLLILFLYFGWKFQLYMCRHAHHPRQPFDNLENVECRRCGPGYGVMRHCNRHRDTECGACAPGHYSSHHSARRPCYPCSRCGTGLYVAHPCTPSRDTVCDSCHTFRGPRNEDFYERCVRPLLLQRRTPVDGRGDDSSSRGVPRTAVLVSSVAAGVLSTALMAAVCVAVSSRRRSCNKVDHRYEAVATQEAVML